MWPFYANPSHPYAEVYHERCDRKSFVSDPLKMAVSPNGKIVFVIGGRKIRMISEGAHPEWTVSFDMNIIDIEMELRRTVQVLDLCDFGEYLIYVYALDSTTLVILDYNSSQKTLRQRLLQVFTRLIHSSESAFSPMHRCYRYTTSQTSYIKVALGDRYCAVVSRERFEGDFISLLLPKDPRILLSSIPIPLNIGSQLTEMNDQLSQALELNITHYISPFFMRNDQDLCFLTVNRITLTIDPKVISCLNIK
ncbi:unnamed protein product [Anisakis simplex]|uniref:PAB-dependent poly(A)-specific ribonuclease subunit 2 n=1 Tax=Anisakis simplex TaxID=6269 RepID=A0A0M3J272_ANISI|nr:unnamed protein product [Anisakis simplex]